MIYKHLLLLSFIVLCTTAHAQEKKHLPAKAPLKNDLPSLQHCLTADQQQLPLFTKNMPGHTQEHDVNSIILDIEKYIDSLHTRTYSDELLNRHFYALRHFFLTTTNQTTVAAEFFYADAPYTFCMYGDTALALHIGAVKDDDPYDLGKMTDKHIAALALQHCLLPSLAALDSFSGVTDIKYIALSTYYGCTDPREGATGAVMPLCLTLVARLSDIELYVAGQLTEKGLLANAQLYLADAGDVRQIGW